MNDSKRWVFTMHKPTRFDKPHLWDDVYMCVYQLEKSSGGSFHYQGYVEFTKPKTFLEMKQFHPTMFCQPARSSALHNIRYCTKQASRVVNPDLYFDSLE